MTPPASTSLIITTYNNPRYLGKVIESVLVQSRLPGEVLIADDGSTQETADLVRMFASRASFPVHHVWHEDKGFRAAKIRNEAVRRSAGDYIILLDGDCVAGCRFVEDHAALSETGCFVQGKRILVSRQAVAHFDHASANSPGRLLVLSLKRQISNIHHLPRLPRYKSSRNRILRNIKSCNMAFFRKDIFAVNGFNEDFIGWGNEDSDLACRFFKYGLLKKVHPFMAICFHLWHPTNKTINAKNQLLLQEAIASQEYFCRNGLVKAN